MYIAITQKKYKGTSHKQILLRESYREDGKVKSRTLLNLTKQPKEQVEAIATALKNKNETIISTEHQSQGKTVGLTFIIVFIMTMLGMIKVFGKTFEAQIALMLITARIVMQSSRLQALYWAKDEDKVLDLLEFDEQYKNRLNKKTIYYGLDYMQENQEFIEDKLFKSYYKNNPPKRVFYDVTSSYVTGDYHDSELVTYGYNRDKKQGTQQIVIGLLADEEGHAISIHTYPGNTNDVKTFSDQLDKLKKRFNLENITIVGDGGMIKSDDIKIIKEMGYDYITSIGKPSIQALIDNKESGIQMSLFDENLKEVIENDKRYILRQNPLRRDEIRETRQSKIDRLQHFIEEKSDYYNTHYKAKTETLEKNISKKIADLKLTKFITVTYTYKEGEITIFDKDKKEVLKTKELVTITINIDEKERNKVAQLDGCYIVTTSLTNTTKDSKEAIHKAYKTLIKVENAFKTLKTQFLEIRPLYLKTDKRIIGHVALSMHAYNIVLKLKEFTKLSNLDFKATIRELSNVKTVINTINKVIVFETIPTVNDNLKILFSKMKLKFPTKI